MVLSMLRDVCDHNCMPPSMLLTFLSANLGIEVYQVKTGGLNALNGLYWNHADKAKKNNDSMWWW